MAALRGAAGRGGKCAAIRGVHATDFLVLLAHPPLKLGLRLLLPLHLVGELNVRVDRHRVVLGLDLSLVPLEFFAEPLLLLLELLLQLRLEPLLLLAHERAVLVADLLTHVQLKCRAKLLG